LADKVSYNATGKRKESVARVRLVPGSGKITVNDKDFNQYFGREAVKTSIIEPLKLTGTDSVYDVIADIDGGGAVGTGRSIKTWYF